MIKDKAYFAELRDKVLEAERAMLYTLGFSLKIRHPHYFIMKIFGEEKCNDDPAVSAFWRHWSSTENNMVQVCHCSQC